MLRSPAAIRGVQLERPDIVWRLPAPSWRHAGHAPAALRLIGSCCEQSPISAPYQIFATSMLKCIMFDMMQTC